MAPAPLPALSLLEARVLGVLVEKQHTVPYRSEQVDDEAERQRLFELGIANFEGYGNYERMAAERRIPVLRLSPR